MRRHVAGHPTWHPATPVARCSAAARVAAIRRRRPPGRHPPVAEGMQGWGHSGRDAALEHG
eukprot:160041-Chlamydomonas_euryale.AAC.6